MSTNTQLSAILQLMRVHQWVKNLFVFLPIFFAAKILDVDLLGKSIIGFIAFSLVASSVYILNDYMDIEADRLHPEKKKRPLASGALSKNTAIILLFFLLFTSVAMITVMGNWKVFFLLSVYFFMNIGYSMGWKHIPLLDVMIIAFGFLLRVLVGGYITDLPVSDWTVILTFSLALIMALGKRRGELMNTNLTGKTRKSLEGYSIEFLNVTLGMVCGITIVFYIMFVLSDEVQSRFHHYVFHTFIFVILGVLRYLQQTMVFNATESPTKMVYKDRFLQVILLLWGLAFTFLIYLK
ncbi:decaprenyl-phosphate phosphoribosyltransferase [Weeksella virosa]|uniref:decaprenyl-phosphate phosphoribosyltransferase n=1 Tax=Weeksella virosa TaxID=1014 RepID=UPI000E001E74|nr:decaprenyl-phosphate phosphoribosyltransferase [Weeksella virosa]MDK7374446.1 decaprenyl-phosphate phosphoribosyltransferase [Weeksella virosa]MDK7675605.1 decaprenyl-phosphate phosphoribosyltransferase [Weeksella virosa]SUP53608.1 phosphoribose diphosphate:decaprenyl-phosphate phosphoribosyltransferase [Weeksella virosa]